MAARASCSSSDELANHTATAVVRDGSGQLLWDGSKLVAPGNGVQSQNKLILILPHC